MVRRVIKAETVVEEMPGPPEGLPTGPNGRPLPFEAAMLKQFYECRTAFQADEQDALTESIGLDPRAHLPSLTPAPDVAETHTETLVFSDSSPARYFRSVTRFASRGTVEIRFVHRGEQEYLTYACYALPANAIPGSLAQPDCYHFGTAPLGPSTKIETAVADVVRREVGEFVRRTRWHGSPHLGDRRPFRRVSAVTVGDDVASREVDHRTGEVRLRVDPGRAHELPRNARKTIRRWTESLDDTLRLPRGGESHFDPEVLRDVFQRLTPVGTAILNQFAGTSWPPLSFAKAQRFVRNRFQGDEILSDAIVTIMTGPERRPSDGRVFALRVLAVATGLSRDRLRRLFRD